MTKILRSRGVWAAVALLFLGIVVAASLFPKVRSGLVIVRLKTSGSLPDIGWMDLFRMIRSGSHFNLPELAKTRTLTPQLETRTTHPRIFWKQVKFSVLTVPRVTALMVREVRAALHSGKGTW